MPIEAALAGAREIGFTVMSISVSLVAVFIPLLLMGGMLGRLFREFAITLSIAMAISMSISLTTTPMLCALILKPVKDENHGKLFAASERFFNGMHRVYEKSLGWALNHQRVVFAANILIILISVFLYIIVPKGFFPQQDTGRLIGSIQGSQDISFQSMKQKMTAINNIVMRDSAVESAISFGGGGSATINTGRMFVALKDNDKRKLTADQVIARLRKKLAAVPGIQVFLQSVQDIRVGGRMSGGQYQYTLQGESIDDLNTWTPRLEQRFRAMKEIADVNSDQQNKGLQTYLTIDRATASRFGITPLLIDQTLSDAFSQRQVSVMYTTLNQYYVVMEADPEYWRRPQQLSSLYVKAPGGAQVPISALCTYESRPALLAVNHQQEFPSSTISFNLPPGMALGTAAQAIEQTTNSMGIPTSIHMGFAGTAQAFQASLSDEPLLLLAALIAVYLVLGILYESLVHPLTIISTLPSAGVGALLAMIVTGTELGVIGVIGIILLIGLVKKNGIMMVDFALSAQRSGSKTPRDAIFSACLLRFRPIMMTTMAALLAALPLALGTGAGSELRRPLGIAIIGGLIISQMLTLFTTPVIYLYLDRAKTAFSRKRRGRDALPGKVMEGRVA